MTDASLDVQIVAVATGREVGSLGGRLRIEPERRQLQQTPMQFLSIFLSVRQRSLRLKGEGCLRSLTRIVIELWLRSDLVRRTVDTRNRRSLRMIQARMRHVISQTLSNSKQLYETPVILYE